VLLFLTAVIHRSIGAILTPIKRLLALRANPFALFPGERFSVGNFAMSATFPAHSNLPRLMVDNRCTVAHPTAFLSAIGYATTPVICKELFLTKNPADILPAG
jgi:hypothetical protein